MLITEHCQKKTDCVSRLIKFKCNLSFTNSIIKNILNRNRTHEDFQDSDGSIKLSLLLLYMGNIVFKIVKRCTERQKIEPKQRYSA